ncbi:b69f7669-16fd-4477-8f2e-bb0d450bfff0 [Thermothielavioides terrestris]|uniref:B69f7669-16fd-4477-8f2e-bb0d450bfff0 n=1 Tax=Thermothielavioides terrestris TaxID=2587410 RepID=A0A446B7B4_9PEZI|nr:b69f7669-16fd-4477-8f2e-bb0d450bfff0 [Thermothielavioides terrestris]
MAANPRIRVREATPADVDTIVDVYFAAFDDNIMNQLMYPNGVSEDSKKKFGSSFRQPAAAEGDAASAAKKGELLLCVAEYLPEGSSADGPGEIVAFAWWQLDRTPRTEEEWQNAPPFAATAESWGEDCDLSVVNLFIGGMTELQRKHAKGEAALYLKILACSPTRQRLGAGSALVQWGVNLADSLGLPCRLEASPVGYALYRKFGFEDVDVHDLNITQIWGVSNVNGSNWGANNAVALAGPAPEGVMRTVIMRRPAKLVGA